MKKSIYEYSVKDINGQDIVLNQYKGKVLLIVNVASKCGFTPQYKGLEEIFEEYKGEVVVLGFPCNQFGQQEPGNAEEIKNFCSLSYDVKFPLFQKIDVMTTFVEMSKLCSIPITFLVTRGQGIKLTSY